MARECEKNAAVQIEEMQRIVDDANASLERQKGVARAAAAQIADLTEEVKRLKAVAATQGSAVAAPTPQGDQGFAGAGEISALRAVLKEREQQITMALNIVGAALQPSGAPAK